MLESFELFLNFLKKKNDTFTDSIIHHNYTKSFLTNSYWHILNIAQKRKFFFNSKFKPLFGISNLIHFTILFILKKFLLTIIFLHVVKKKIIVFFFLKNF